MSIIKFKVINKEYLEYFARHKIESVYSITNNDKIVVCIEMIIDLSPFYYLVPIYAPSDNDYNSAPNGEKYIKEDEAGIIRISQNSFGKKELCAVININDIIPVPQTEIRNITDEDDWECYKGVVDYLRTFIDGVSNIDKVNKISNSIYEDNGSYYEMAEQLCIKYCRLKKIKLEFRPPSPLHEKLRKAEEKANEYNKRISSSPDSKPEHPKISHQNDLKESGSNHA